MIKIKYKTSLSAPLNEVTTRYLLDKFKLPQEFADWLNSNYRQNADVLVQIFLASNDNIKQVEKTAENYEKYFKRFINHGGHNVDFVLTRYPAKRREFSELAGKENFNYNTLYKKVLDLKLRANFPKELERQAKKDFPKSYDSLIEIFCATHSNWVKQEEQIPESWSLFINPAEGVTAKDMDLVFRKMPAEKDELTKLAIRNWHEFSTKVENIANQIKDQEAEIIINFEDGFKWIFLDRNFCALEAQRMRHCGRATQKDGTLYSLRDSENKPYVTIEKSKINKSIYQIKAESNFFPPSEYWHYIYEFFKHFDIQKEDILEPLASEDYYFMSYFDKNFPEPLEDQIDNLRKLAFKTREDSDLWYKFVKEFNKFMATNIDLTIEQYVEIFEIYFFEYYKGMNGETAIDTFFKSFEPKLDMDFNLELISKITDLLEERGAFNDPKISTALIVGILIGKFKILEYFKNKSKDQSEVTGAFQNLPILKRLMEILKDANAKEEEKNQKLKMSEHRRNLPSVRFKMDHRGYFRLWLE